MSHALIIEDNMMVSRAVEDRLISLGFDSFDHTWTARQAMQAATKRPPDLVVVGDVASGTTPEQFAPLISNQQGAPIVMISAASCVLYQMLADELSILGSFPLSELDRAVALSSHASLHARAAWALEREDGDWRASAGSVAKMPTA